MDLKQWNFTGTNTNTESYLKHMNRLHVTPLQMHFFHVIFHFVALNIFLFLTSHICVQMRLLNNGFFEHQKAVYARSI